MRNHNGFAGHNAPAQRNQPVQHNGSARPETTSFGAMMRLDEARERIQADDCGKWDTLTPRRELRLKDGCLAFALDRQEEQWQHLPLSNWATGQLCARLGVPAAYFRRCPSVLQDVQANYWLRELRDGVAMAKEAKGSDGDEWTSNEGAIGDKADNDMACTCSTENRKTNDDERWLLRVKGDTVRAVLSERYSPLDNATLMNTLLHQLSSRYRVDWFGLSSESLHLRLIDPEKTREVLPDDALSVGVHLANSEVGLRAVTVDALVYRLVCKNGLVRLVKGKSFLHRRHVYLDEARFAAALQEAVAGALGEAESFIEQLASTTKQRVEDGTGTLEQLAKQRGLPDHLLRAMTNVLHQEGKQSETLYGVVNAVTEAAQRLPDEARYDLEVLAGHLAEHGVAAYAPRRNASKTVRVALSENLTVQNEEVTEQDDEDEIVEDDILVVTREMFGAQIVSRVPHDAQKREVEAAEVTA